MKCFLRYFGCGLVGLLLSDVASAFTAPLTGALVIANGRSHVTLSAQIVDASSSRSDFLKTSFATIAAITTTILFAPTIVFAAEDAVDDLSMPSVEEQNVSEVSRMQRTSAYYYTAHITTNPEISTLRAFRSLRKSSLRLSWLRQLGRGTFILSLHAA